MPEDEETLSQGGAMRLQAIFVAGAGQMGSGIAQVSAETGHRVILYDLTEELARRGFESVKGFVDRSVTRGRMEAGDAGEALERIETTADLSRAADADFVIEAVVEDREVKRDLFCRLDEVCREEVILATNTSSLSVTELAGVTSRPDRVIGTHFMNPVPLMKLVEVIRGLVTSDATFQAARRLVLAMGKEPVSVNDYPGFVVNRLLIPMINEAISCVHEGVATPEDVDRIMTLGANHPMGPLALADLIGLDVVLAIMRSLHEGFADSRYRPAPRLVKMVEAGHLGKKTGRGFYQYGR